MQGRRVKYGVFANLTTTTQLDRQGKPDGIVGKHPGQRKNGITFEDIAHRVNDLTGLVLEPLEEQRKETYQDSLLF